MSKDMILQTRDMILQV